jgi:hypothetical protein
MSGETCKCSADVCKHPTEKCGKEVKIMHVCEDCWERAKKTFTWLADLENMVKTSDLWKPKIM